MATINFLNLEGSTVSQNLIAALQNPDLYPHEVEGFQVIETHISWVILTGPYAYKLKKPVNFGFLDFTELSGREHVCNEELRLNQRLTEGLYQRDLRHAAQEALRFAKLHEQVLPGWDGARQAG